MNNNTIDILQAFLKAHNQKAFISHDGNLSMCNKDALSMLDDEHRITVQNFGDLINKHYGADGTEKNVKNFAAKINTILSLDMLQN